MTFKNTQRNKKKKIVDEIFFLRVYKKNVGEKKHLFITIEFQQEGKKNAHAMIEILIINEDEEILTRERTIQKKKKENDRIKMECTI